MLPGMEALCGQTYTTMIKYCKHLRDLDSIETVVKNLRDSNFYSEKNEVDIRCISSLPERIASTFIKNVQLSSISSQVEADIVKTIAGVPGEKP